jgi:uncharacterized protein (TIGR02596 family)
VTVRSNGMSMVPDVGGEWAGVKRASHFSRRPALPRTRARRRCGFSLVELVVVLAVVALMAALAAPSVMGGLKSLQLTQAVDMIQDELGYARDYATGRDLSVEIRFYQYGLATMPGESVSNPSSGKFRAVQLFEINDSGVASPLGKVQRLPDAVIVDSGNSLSDVLGAANASSVPTSTSGSALGYSLPGLGLQYNAVCFRFLPDGSTTLSSPASSWFITLHYISAGDNLSAPPSNFCTIQLDAVSGHLRIFRP